MSRVRTLFILMVVSALAAACSSGEAPSEEPAPPVEQAPPSAEELRQSSLSESFDRIKSYAQNNPRELHHILNQIANFKAEAAGTEFEKKAEKLASDARGRFKEDAEAAYEKVREKAEKLVAGGRAREALEVLGEYPAEFSSTEWQDRIDEMAEPIEREVRADQRLDTLREQVKEQLENHNPEAALKLAERYPQSMRTGKRREEWEKIRSELSAKVDAIRERRREAEALPWDDLFTGKDMNKWSPQSGEWELRDGCIVGKYGGDSSGFIYCGTEESSWQDFILELEFKIVSGEFLVLGIRGKNEGGCSVFDQIGFYPGDFPLGKFHCITVEARGDTYTVRGKDSQTIFAQEAEPGYTKGPICFFIASGAQVHIRKVRIKMLK